MHDEREDKRPVARFTYLNHRGELSNRVVFVDAIEYLTAPGFKYQPGWFVSGWCVDKQARRSFALVNMRSTAGELLPGRTPHFKLLTFP